jgi:hypothetical protein
MELSDWMHIFIFKEWSSLIGCTYSLKLHYHRMSACGGNFFVVVELIIKKGNEKGGTKKWKKKENQHPEDTAFSPPSLYSPSPLATRPTGTPNGLVRPRTPAKMPSAAVRVLSCGSDAQALGRKLPNRRRDRLRQVRTMHDVRPDPAFGESPAGKTLPPRTH